MPNRYIAAFCIMVFSAEIAFSQVDALQQKPFRTLNGHDWHWNMGKRGKMILWQIWCPQCPPALATIPRLSHLHKQYQKDGLEVIAVCVKREDSHPPLMPDVLKLRKRFTIPYTILLAPDRSQELFTRYPLKAFPTMYLLDSTGKVIRTFEGNMDDAVWESLEKQVSQGVAIKENQGSVTNSHN